MYAIWIWHWVPWHLVAVLKTKPKYHYAVKNYRANSNENLDQSFHFFPGPNQKTVKVDIYFGNLENVYIVTAWKKATKIKVVKSPMIVRSRHFTKRDYFFSGKKIFINNFVWRIFLHVIICPAQKSCFPALKLRLEEFIFTHLQILLIVTIIFWFFIRVRLCARKDEYFSSIKNVKKNTYIWSENNFFPFNILYVIELN